MAAQFDRMKADALAPDVDWGAWNSNAVFFNSGISGQWVTAFSNTDLAKYVKRTRQLISPLLYGWLHGEFWYDPDIWCSVTSKACGLKFADAWTIPTKCVASHENNG